MRTFATRSFHPGMLLTVIAALAIGSFSDASAVTQTYMAVLSGAAEAVPNASPAVGSAEVTLDLSLSTMRVQVSFVGLLGTVTACHIHATTAVAGTGTAGVATQLPTFSGFPSGVTAGTYDQTFDMTLASSYSAAFITSNGGTVASAMTALFNAIAAGKAYLNVHTTSFGGGEIRGFLQSIDPTPAANTTWGRVKQLYR